ncbi:DUF1707 SHOCT-like domain-containing protein [Amycolatopsis vancoresmycina]|uniref:DUF1707 domain-containing protein n=1 Tax=Amycolatopsis vancoresmycina DSM 44592 TaxID=1292037 RepID=R1G7G6_9PSEU|nr:DUF1707 domain-containing protein [Amycolatopsis vancoresmycina]EOD67387.1 hypothetical protein H480_16705 [Amycolatopsis vancoresmycina DSM 44592]
MGDMRLSDAERQDALDVLEEHVRTGRLDIDEYGARSAKVTAAKRVSELVPLFDDLPSPRPSALLAGASAPQVPVFQGDNALVRFLTAGAVPIAIILAIAVLILSRGRLLIISVALPLVVAMIAGARRRRS